MHAWVVPLRNWVILDYEEPNGLTVRPWAPFLLSLWCSCGSGRLMAVGYRMRRITTASKVTDSWHKTTTKGCPRPFFLLSRVEGASCGWELLGWGLVLLAVVCRWPEGSRILYTSHERRSERKGNRERKCNSCWARNPSVYSLCPSFPSSYFLFIVYSFGDFIFLFTRLSGCSCLSFPFISFCPFLLILFTIVYSFGSSGLLFSINSFSFLLLFLFSSLVKAWEFIYW